MRGDLTYKLALTLTLALNLTYNLIQPSLL